MNLPVVKYIKQFAHDLNTKFFGKRFRSEISMLLVACIVFAGTASYIPSVGYTDAYTSAEETASENRSSGHLPSIPSYAPSDVSEVSSTAYEDAPMVLAREFTPAPYVLNFAYEYPEGSDTSYAETLIRELIQKDSQWYAGMYDQANVSPANMASRLGRAYSTVIGRYNPSAKSQDPNDSSTWVISNFTNVNVSFLGGDGQYTSAVSNAQEILSMASVYAYYNDLTELSQIRTYIDQLWSASHSYSISMGSVYYCSGCVSVDQSQTEEETEDSELEGEDTFILGRAITTEIVTGNTAYVVENNEESFQIDIQSVDETDPTADLTSDTSPAETEDGPGLYVPETTAAYEEETIAETETEPESSMSVLESLAETAESVIYEEEDSGPTIIQVGEDEDETESSSGFGTAHSVNSSSLKSVYEETVLETIPEDDTEILPGIETVDINPAAAFADVNDITITPLAVEEESTSAARETSAAVPETTAAPETTTEPETTTAPETTAPGLKHANSSGSGSSTAATTAPETTGTRETATAPETTTVSETTTTHETTSAPETPESDTDESSGLKRASSITNAATTAATTSQHTGNTTSTSSDSSQGVTRITTGTTRTNVSTTSELTCPGHIDLQITARITTLTDGNDLFSVDVMGNTVEEGSNWQGWTERNKALVNHINRQDWLSVYDLDIIMENTGTPLTDLEIEAYMKLLPTDISDTRREIIRFALQSVGKIPYYWGGKPSSPNYTGNSFGSITIPDHRGRILRGLDCSGWINWVYWSVTGSRLPYEGTDGLRTLGRQVARADLQPGDIIVITGSTPHVIMFLSWAENGQIQCIHENGTYNNVTVGVMTANWPYYRNLLD